MQSDPDQALTVRAWGLRSIRGLLRVALITLVLLGVVEAIARWVLSRVYDRRFPAALVQIDRYGHSNGLVPNSSGEVWGASFSSDAFGGRNTGVAPDTSGYWLYLGDSVGEGVGVDDSSCAVGQVARTVKDLRVVNLAHIGHSTCDEWNVLGAWTDTCSRIHRVTMLYTLNDVYGNATAEELPALGGADALGSLRRWMDANYATYKLLKLFLLQGSDHYYRYDEQFYREGDPHFAEAMDCLDRSAALCRSRGIAFNVVMLPYRSQVEASPEVQQVPQRMVGDHCRAVGIPFTDALPAFRMNGDAHDLFLFADEIHLSARGHRVLAEMRAGR